MKYEAKNNKSSSVAIASGVVSGFAVQIIGCMAMAWLTGKGSVSEGYMSLAVSVIRMVGVLATIVISWWLSPNDTGWLISAGIVSLLPVIAAMLLWSVDVKELAIGVASSLAIIAACAWGRNRRVKGNYRSFHKKRNR